MIKGLRGFKQVAQNDEGLDLIPTRGTKDSAGYDLKACYGDIICAGERKLIKTGVTVYMPSNEQAEIRPRSGLAIKYGVTVLNSPGTIDSDYYPNEIGVVLINHGDKPFHIQAGDRIAQLVFTGYKTVGGDAVLVERRGGFGHTGK